MISGEFHIGPIDQITIIREDRLRKKIETADLEASIRARGLIHPIVITRDFVLVAGERRLTACRKIGYTNIAYQFVDETDPIILRLIELEENTKRSDLSWQEINDAVAESYKIHKSINPAASFREIGELMGRDYSDIAGHVLLKEEREKNPRLNEAATFRTARDTARASRERETAARTESLVGPSHGVHVSIRHADFQEWAPDYNGSRYNVIHCDFPYGINSQDSGINPSGYDDSLGVYLELLKTTAVYLDNFCADQAHMIFWFSPEYWQETWESLKLFDGFTFIKRPLIWHKSDGRGIAPDQQRRPRQVYETAFFGWRGDRKIVSLKDNLYAAPSGGIHPHEKSELALQHFLSMVVDRNTSVFDPTCGSGSALRAARSLGAKRVLGLEKDKQYADDALRLFEASGGSGGGRFKDFSDALG